MKRVLPITGFHKKTHLQVFAVLLAVIVSFCSPAPLQAASKPILIMGAGSGITDKAHYISDILEPNEFTFEEAEPYGNDGATYAPPDSWENFGLVIINNSIPNRLSATDVSWINSYLHGGGRLLITGPILNTLKEENKTGNAQWPDWLGTKGYTWFTSGIVEKQSAMPDTIADGIDLNKVFAVPDTSTLAPTTITSATPWVKRDGKAVLFRHQVGDGEVIFIGIDYFRVKAKGPDLNDPNSYASNARRLIRRCIEDENTQTVEESIEQGLTNLGATEPVVWDRDFNNARGAEFSSTPYPLSADVLTKRQLDLGMGEWESFPFYISSPVADPNFAILEGNLISDEGDIIPPDKIRLRIQGLAAPHLKVGPFWLLDPQGGNASFNPVPLRTNRSVTMWATVDSRGIKPGVYKGSFRFTRQQMPPLEIEIKIWPVRLPDHNYFESEATFQWKSLLWWPGQAPGPLFTATPNLAILEKHFKNLAEHHISYNNNGADWTQTEPMRQIKIASTGASLYTAAATGQIDINNLPRLDFSYFDPFVELPLKYGMPYIQLLLKNRPEQWYGNLAAFISPNTPMDGEDHEKVKRWMYSEIMRYLNEKGIRKTYSTMADEIKPSQVDDLVARSQLVREYGIRTAFTVTGDTERNIPPAPAPGTTPTPVPTSALPLHKANPHIDRWIWNVTGMKEAKDIIAADPNDGLIDPTDEEYTYVADWHRAPYTFNRSMGTFSAYNNLKGLLIHGYNRWYPNQGAVFNTPDGPIDTEGWEGARDGIEDARYYSRVRLLLAAARQRPGLSTLVTTIEGRLNNWVGTDSTDYIYLKGRAFGVGSNYLFPNKTKFASMQQMKKEMLQSIKELEDEVSTAVTMGYGGFPVVNTGTAVAKVNGSEEARTALNEAIVALGGTALTQHTGATSSDPIIAIGSQQNNTMIALMVAQGQIDLDAVQNIGSGSYRIFTAPNRIVIYAINTAGEIKGAQVLANLLDRSDQVTP